MEDFQNGVWKAMSVSRDPTLSSAVSSIASTFEKAKASLKDLTTESSTSSSTPPPPPPPPPPLLLTKQPRNLVSLWTCSKLCAVCFVGGIIVGYTLKRRVRRWASKLLRRIKDD